MGLNITELVSMPDIEEYATIQEAANDPRVPYTGYWVRRLAQEGKISAKKFGSGSRATWLVHMPSLVAYIEKMDALGTQKHASN